MFARVFLLGFFWMVRLICLSTYIRSGAGRGGGNVKCHGESLGQVGRDVEG